MVCKATDFRSLCYNPFAWDSRCNSLRLRYSRLQPDALGTGRTARSSARNHSAAKSVFSFGSIPKVQH